MTEKRKIRFGIFHRVLLTMVLVAALPLVAVWYANFLISSETLEQNINDRFAESLTHLTYHVDSWVDMNRRMLEQNARLPDIQSMDGEKQPPLLKLITDIYDWNYLAFTVATDGQNIGRSDGKKLRFYGDRVYVTQVLHGADMGRQVLIGKTSGKPALVLSVPIRNSTEEVAGVLAIAMGIAELSERITSTRVGDTGFAFLVDEYGKIIAHPSEKLTSSRQNISDNPAVAAAYGYDRKSLVYTDTRGRRVIAYMNRTADGWLMVMQQDYEEAFESLRETNLYALILLAVTVVLVIIVAFIFSTRLSQPIMRLTQAADAISRGRMDTEIEGTDRTDEIGLLAAAIVRLRNSTRLALERLTRKSRKPD